MQRGRAHPLIRGIRAGKSPEYHAWRNMRARCLNPRHPYFGDYGGRGISICERWSRFWDFFEDMGPRPTPRHTLERIDNAGDYEPRNCKWATRTEQARNTRRNVWIELDGTTVSVEEAAEKLGVKRATMDKRRHYGRDLFARKRADRSGD